MLKPLTNRERTCVVAGIVTEGVILDVAKRGVGPGSRSGRAKLLIDIVLPAQVCALGSGVTEFNRYAKSQFALDGEVPTLQIGRRRINFKPVRCSYTGKFGERCGKRTVKRQ